MKTSTIRYIYVVCEYARFGFPQEYKVSIYVHTTRKPTLLVSPILAFTYDHVSLACSTVVASNQGFLFWILSHSFGEIGETKSGMESLSSRLVQ